MSANRIGSTGEIVVITTTKCPDVGSLKLFDCGNDDYFYAGKPPLFTYLASHWNVADSSFLVRVHSVLFPDIPAP